MQFQYSSSSHRLGQQMLQRKKMDEISIADRQLN